VWVNNSREGNVKYYNATGAYRGSWIAEEVESEDYSRGIWVDKAGRVLVNDAEDRRLVIADKLGNTINKVSCGAFGGLVGGCTGFATDDAGNIYAASAANDTIVKFAPDGTQLLTWGSKGTEPGQLGQPYDVDIFKERLYVSESENARISVFSLDGEFIGKFGTKGNRTGQLKQPRSISIDNRGRLYIVDGVRERVLVYQIR
jgi:DNA-binding beta-propeller fold protein YncE